jgi:hypothetical protein
MLNDYFALVDPDTGVVDEFVNVNRTTTYMAAGLRPSTFVNVTACGCGPLPAALGAPGGTVVETAETVETRSPIDIGAVTPDGQALDPASDLTAAGDWNLVFDNPATGAFTGAAWTIPSSAPGPGYRVVGVRVTGAAAVIGSASDVKGEGGFVDGVGGFQPGSVTVVGADAAAWSPYPGQAGVLGVGVPTGASTLTFTLNTPYDAGAPTFAAFAYFVSSLVGFNPHTWPDSFSIATITWLWERTVTSDGYTTPIADNAPWYDPLVPESALFAGVLPVSVEGLDANPVTREVTRLVGGGAALGALTFTERETTFQVELIGASCCAVAYGLKWLTAVLNRRCGGERCARSDLTFLSCCPDSLSGCAPDIDEYRSTVRKVTNLGLLSGPTVVERRGGGCGSCGCNATLVVEFTLVAGNPGVFGVDETVLPATDLLPVENDNCLDLHWRCEPAPDCESQLVIFDAACGSLPPPPAPQLSSSCMCDPLAVHRLMVPVADPTEEWASFVASFTVTSGALPLRNLAFRLFRRSGDTCGHTYDPAWDTPDVGDVFDPLGYPPCDVLGSLGIMYVPPNSTMFVDGVRRRAYIEDVNGNRYTAARFVYAASGSPYQWIEMACGGNYCISVEADAFNTHEGATVAIDITYREG